MSSYAAVMSANFRTLLQYRTAAVAGFTTQIFWGFIRVMIFEAFFRSSTADQPMTVDEVTTYIWLGQAFIALLPWNTDRELDALIRSGLVGYELLRPVDLYNFWLARAIAYRTAPTLLRAVPLLALALLFFGMDLPASPAAGAAFVLSMMGALLISSAFTTLINVTMMWTVSGQGAAEHGGHRRDHLHRHDRADPLLPRLGPDDHQRPPVPRHRRHALPHLPRSHPHERHPAAPGAPAGLGGRARADWPVGAVARPATPRDAGRLR